MRGTKLAGFTSISMLVASMVSAQMQIAPVSPFAGVSPTIGAAAALSGLTPSLPRMQLAAPMPSLNAAGALADRRANIEVPKAGAAGPVQAPAAATPFDPASVKTPEELGELFAAAKGQVPSADELIKPHLGFYFHPKNLSEKHPVLLLALRRGEILQAQPFDIQVDYLYDLLRTAEEGMKLLRAKDTVALTPVEFDSDGAHFTLKTKSFESRYEIRRHQGHLIMESRETFFAPGSPARTAIHYMYFFMPLDLTQKS